MGLSCHDIQATQGARKSGVYLIHPPNLAQGPWRVYCDLESEGGGWIVFQVRDDVEPKENFMRGWEDYKVGFGDFDREFWLGEVQGHEEFKISVILPSARDWSVSIYAPFSDNQSSYPIIYFFIGESDTVTFLFRYDSELLLLQIPF